VKRLAVEDTVKTQTVTKVYFASRILCEFRVVVEINVLPNKVLEGGCESISVR
jgi:hypothetical protein